MKMTRMKIVLVVALLLVVGQALEGVGLNPIKPYHLNKGKKTKYLFSLRTQEEITSKAKIKVKFPAEFEQSAVAANLACMASSDSYAWKSVACTYKTDSVILTLGSIKDEKMEILIESPRNPTLYSMSSYFELCLMFDNSLTNCNKEFGKVVFPDSPHLTPSTPTFPNVTSLSSRKVGKASTYQFKFTTSTSYGTGNAIRVTLPPGYKTTASPVCQMTGTYNQIIKTFVWPNGRSIECQLVNKTISTNEVLKIIGIYNPKFAGTFGNTNDGFIIEILEGTTTIVREEIYVQMAVTISAGDMAGSISQQNKFIKAKAKYTVYLNLQNPLTSTDYIRIRMDDSWIFYENECSVVSGITLNSDNFLACENSTDNTYTYLKINNFQSASVTNQLVFNIYVGTPIVIGSYDVNVITANLNGTMDELSLVVSLNETYGTLDMLSINAITANAKVPVEGTGPLQLTFFLNYELPQTNVLTDGIFKLKIFPQIPLPPELINGVLKCYFYNDIPAETCTWDNSVDPTYTSVIIHTPETSSFQYSEIPITITTEGAVNDSMIGITIADKVTRYRFEIYMYKQQNYTTPTEVFYTEYIADAIPLLITATSLTKEVSEKTAIKIEFDNPYNFTLDIMDNIRYKIEFLSGGGWASALGYDSETIYKRFPCLFYSPGYSPEYDDHVRCDLYTYTDGPHASLTDSSERGPYIIMYGFEKDLLINEHYILEVAGLEIGSSTGTQTKIRFSIIEQTPDMLTKYIELYYSQVDLFTTSAQSFPTAATTGVSISLSDPYINSATTHTNSFTVSTNSHLISYEYDMESTPSFADKYVACSSSNKCSYFGYPVNWIIEYPTTGSFPSSISSALAVTNGKYSGNFGCRVRAYTSAGLILKKNAFDVPYTPRTITNSRFYLLSGGNTVYRGQQNIYRLYFYAITSVPANGMVRLTVSDGVQFSRNPYCSSTNVSPLNQHHGLLCENQNSDLTLKIYNIPAMSAGNYYYYDFKLFSQIGSAGSINPKVTIKTYYSVDVDYSVVDQVISRSLNNTLSNQHESPADFSIENPKITYEPPRVDYIGRYVLKFRPSSDSLAAAKIKLQLPNHSWNGGYWTTPNAADTDPLVCFINVRRVPCTYTLSPFIVLLDAQEITSGSDNIIILDTEYLPENGIKHPAQGGEYVCILSFLDGSDSTIESTSFYHRIRPQKLRNFVVETAITDAGVENMYTVHFQVNSNSYPVSNTASGTYSRILIEFPTLDSLGNRLFEDDLGGYQKTGQIVGCYMNPYTNPYIDSPSNNLRCRLIKSEVVGDPAIVEVLNFRGFSSSQYKMKLRIARIYNPTRTVTSVPISIRIENVEVSTNHVTELYYDTFDVFLNSQVAAPAADNTVSCHSDFTHDNSEVGDLQWLRFYPHDKGYGGDFYYVFQLPIDYEPDNIEDNGPSYCHGSYHYECMSFPDISYIVVSSHTNNFEVRMFVTYPKAVAQYNYNVKALVWQGGRYRGIEWVTLTTTCQYDFRGTLSSYSGVSAVEDSNGLMRNRRKFEVKITFQVRHTVPVGGSIEIKWPNDVPAAYPHCRSMTNIGSALFARGGSENGEIGCQVQSTRNWVVTEFAQLNAGSTVILAGHIDLPADYHYLGSGEVITYNNTHATSIRTNGYIIDYHNDGDFELYLQNYDSNHIDTEISLIETLPLRESYVGPLQFKFRLPVAFPGPNQAKIRVRIPQRSVYGEAGGFSYDDTKKHICQLKDILTHDEYGCIITAITEDSTSNKENVLFEMVLSSALTSSDTYTLLIKPHSGADPEGLNFPTQAGLYKIDVSFDEDESGNFDYHDHLYLEVYGPQWTQLEVLSFISIVNNENIIWVKLTPTIQIPTTHQFVIEIPTKGANGWNLFANDLGTGTSDGDDIITDVVSGDFTTNDLTCRLFHGDQTNYKPVKIVCALDSNFDNTHLLHFAFKVVNPTVSPQMSIPFFVYSVNLDTMYKSNFGTVERAVFLKNTLLSGYDDSDVGRFRTPANELQTSNTYLEMVTRNPWTTDSEDYYLVFLDFPIRTNGVITDGCKDASDNVYGDAYYHEHLWVIICSFTDRNTGSPGGGNVAWNMRIYGFYTPWYYLSSSEYTIMTYHTHSNGEYTGKASITDNFPQLNPKTSSTDTFTITAVHQTSTMYKGTRDDYIISFKFSTAVADTIDISYMKLIAVIFPNAQYGLLGQDCMEYTDSDVEIEECWIVPGTRLLWIRPVEKTSYTSDMTISIITRDLAIRNPSSDTINRNSFAVKFYSWANRTEPSIDPINNNVHCFLVINGLASSTISFADNPTTYPSTTYNYLRFPHQRYYLETPFSSLTNYAPFEFMFKADRTFNTLSGSTYHKIMVYYSTDFTDQNQLKIRDLEVFRPVCYLANNRIRSCTIDTTNNKITMSFQFGLTLNSEYHVLFALVDPRNPATFGFLPTKAVSDVRFEYMLGGSSTVYYTETSKFPSLFSLPSGATQGPFRGIVDGTIEYGHAIQSIMNVVNMKLTFNRTDITGLVFEIPLRDDSGNLLYSQGTAAFLSTEDGSTYPCGNHGLSAGGNVKCIIQMGDFSDLTTPTRIIMTDFTYVSQMNCRFIFRNPDTVNAFFSIKVKAYGGTKSASNLYGNKYMGEWEFTNIFKALDQSTYPPEGATYMRSTRMPDYSPWKNETTHYVFSKSQTLNAGRISMAEILLYDSSLSGDKELCQATLGSSNNYDDLIEYTHVSGGVIKKYAYFIRTWQSAVNLQQSSSGGWGLEYIKCKSYSGLWDVYYFFSDTDVEKGVNNFIYTQGHSLGSNGVSAPLNLYYDQNYRTTDGTDTHMVMEVDVTPMMQSAVMSKFEFRNNDEMVLKFTLSRSDWGNILSCQVLGGIVSTSATKPAICVVQSATLFYIRYIAGFEEDPLLASDTNQRIKVKFIVDGLTSVNSITRTVELNLHSNFDTFSHQPIATGTATQVNNCYDADSSATCYIHHSGSSNVGLFQLQKLSDTFMQVAYSPSSTLSFGGSHYYHYFDINFDTFSFDSSVTVSDVKVEITTTNSPGTGDNNTINFDTITADKGRFNFYWANSRPFSNLFGGMGAAADNQLDSNEYLIFYITIQSPNPDLPALHHDYIWAIGTYYTNYGSTVGVRKISYLPTQDLATTASIATLTNNRGAPTELSFELNSLKTAIGSGETNYLLLAEFIGSTSWTSSSDPFSSYTNTALTDEPLECKCISAVGAISISTTSPYTNANCRRRLPVSSGFNAYAILIDFDASVGEDVKCFFPEFRIAAGMSFSVEFKVVYGNSYPPDITGSRQYGSVFRKQSNTLTFSGSTPDMSTSYVTSMNSLSESPNFYASSVDVGSSFSSTYTVSGSWGSNLNAPYVYLNYRKAGPIPAVSFCIDSNLFFECRVYNSRLNLVIAKLKSSSTNSFSMSRGSSDIFYPSSQYSVNSDFASYAYISNGGSWRYSRSLGSRSQSNLSPISSNSFLIYHDLYGSSRSTFESTIIISMNIQGKTLYNYLDTGSKITVDFSGITHKKSCQIWVQNEPEVELVCVVGSNQIVVYSERADYSTSNNIFMSLGITNPSTSSTSFTMILYDYYYSNSRYSKVIHKTSTLTTDNTFYTNVEISKSRLSMYPFKSRISLIANAPLRIRFKTTGNMVAYPSSYVGFFKITNQQIAYSTNFLCYFRRYSNYVNMDQQTEVVEVKAQSWSVSGSTLNVYPPWSMPITSSYYYELVIMPIGINPAGCTALGCASQSGFQQTQFEPINFITYTSTGPSVPTLMHNQYQRLYQFMGSAKIGLQEIYVLCAQALQTSLYFKFLLDFTSAVEYPAHYLEFIFWDLPPSTFTGYSVNDVIPCQLSSNFVTISNREEPGCVLAEADDVHGFVKVRIVNIGALAVGSYWMTLDDIILPNPGTSDNTKKFDLSIQFMGPSNLKHESFFREVFLIDQTNSSSASSLSISFTNPSITQYGSSIVGSLSFNWPFDTSSSGYESKVAFNFYKGYSSTWDNTNSVTFVDNTGTYQLLWVNKKLNKFVFAVPQKSSSTGTTLNITAISNPFPFQKEIYENSGSTPTMEVNFYNNFYHQTAATFNQPAFSVFTKAVPIVNMDQNLPANSYDTYPTTNKIGSGATTILRLGVVIDETSANIISRDLDILDIQFTSGVSYIEECRVVRNSSQYVNPKSTCQTYKSGSNWHIIIYHVTESQMNVYWWVQAVGTFSATSIGYTSRLKAPNLVVEYEASYPVTISNYYSTAKSIPTTLSWLNRKYVKNFFENQVRYLEAVAGQTTPYFRFRMTCEAAWDGSGDYINVHIRSTTTFSSRATSSNLICQFLPAVSAERDFSVGYYGECRKTSDANGHIYEIRGPFGGWNTGWDYLIQIQEPDVVATSFNGPVTPGRQNMVIHKNNNGNHRYDAAVFQFYRYFTSVQILHTTTTVDDYDTLTITYIPKIAVPAGGTTTETVLQLAVSGVYHEDDGGLKAIYASDGTTVENGFRFSEVVDPSNGNEVTTVLFSEYSEKQTPLTFSLALQNAYTSGSTYVWRIPLLKNPSTANVALRYNLTLLHYPASTSYGIIYQKHQCINEYYTVSDTSQAFTPSIINSNKNVQVVAGIDLAMDLGSYSLTQWDTVSFKLDNSEEGLLQNFAAGNDTSNYDYYYFHTINMVVAQKKTTNTITNVGIGALSSSLNYQRDFGFNWVKVYDSSNAPMTTSMPKTLKVGTPATKTLNYLTSYPSAATLTALEGSQYKGSTVMYQLDLVVPIIPKGGEIQILVNSANIETDNNAHCRVGSSFVRSDEDLVLRCYRIDGGFKITGFSQVSASTTLRIYFHLKSLNTLTAENIEINIYGIYGDLTSPLIKKNNVVTVTHVADSVPSVLEHREEIYTPMYSSIHYNNYYEFEGNLRLRSHDLLNGDFIQIQDPFGMYGTPRLLIKKNDSSVDGWTELSMSVQSSGSIYRYQLPTNYNNVLTILNSVEYIWRYSSTFPQDSNNSTEPGFVPSAGTDSNQFYIWGYDGSAYEYNDYDFIVSPKPFVLTIRNRYPAAGRKTMLEFSFMMDVSVNSNDWMEFTFDTNNLIDNMFANDLEDQAVEGEEYKVMDCREWNTNNYISTGRMNCYLYYGDSGANPPKAATLVVPLDRSINGFSGSDNYRFMISNILNPAVVGMNVGVEMNIFRTCENEHNKKCSIYAAKGWYVTTSNDENLQTSASTFSLQTNVILDTSIWHRFQFVTTASIGTSDAIYIVYPENFQGVMPSTCAASNYYCYVFPLTRWVVLIPTGNVISGAGTLTITLTSYMNNAYYLQAYTENFRVTVSRGSGSSLGDFYEILQSPHETIKRSIGGSSTLMTITTTQTSGIWLRNYANTAIFDLRNIYMDSRIKAIYLKAPTDVTQWDVDYCNASITTTEINTYPLRFTCRVFDENTTNPVLQITVEDQDMSPYNSVWDDLTIKVHAKFTIDDFPADPDLYVTLPITSGTFHAYGSVNTTSVDPKYYLSECSNTIEISQHQVPIISDITFNEESFAYRVARVNNKEVFYLLLKPTVTDEIAQMIFQIPVEFDYPGVFQHDNCFMIGRSREDQDFCKQSREGGKTLIKVTPENYNNEVKIIQLGSILEQSWFTAPSLPGNFYNMTVELYGTAGNLLEKQTIDISPVYGEYFDIPSIVLNNIQDGDIAESVYDLTFVTGSLQIPPGATTTATNLKSEMRFIFENYNAADPQNVFKNDLGTGLEEGAEVGCVIHSGIVALEGKRLTCTLHKGTNSTDKPMIVIKNYDYIDPATSISVSFGGIQSLDEGGVNTISIGVLIDYGTAASSTYLYIPTPTLPDPTNNTLNLPDRNANISNNISNWHNQWTMSCSYYQSNVVREETYFRLSMIVPYSYPFSGYQYTSTGVDDEFILLKFQPKHVIDPYNPIDISCAQCSEIQVFYETGIVRFRHTQTIQGSSWYSFNFDKFPSSAYTLANQAITVDVEIYANYRLYAYRNLTINGTSRTVEKCELFNFGVLSVSSLNGGEIGVDYTFSLITNHYIPINGAISITIPASYGNMVSNGVTCSLSGFGPNVYCLIQTPSRVDIYLNGTDLSLTSSYKVILSGLQNPNEDSSGLIFYVSSYFDDNIYNGHIICENSVTPPTITVKAIRTCTLSWSTSFVNKGFNASHTFVMGCNDLFRGDSVLYISLPNDFSTKNQLGDIYCTSSESSTLVEDMCHLSYINGTFMLWTNLQATSQTSLTLNLHLINPTNNTYNATAYVQSRGVTYSETERSYLTILSTAYQTASSRSAFLMNSPKEAGLMATYIFKISPMTTFTPNNLAIEFPSNFYIKEGELTVGLTTTDNSLLFDSLTYDNVQKLVNNISQVNSVSLKAYPSFTVEGNAIYMTNLSSHHVSTEWTYVFIRGVKNPSEYIARNFTISYYILTSTSRTLQWVLQSPLTYYISSPPQYLSITTVDVSDHDLLYPSVYTFQFKSDNTAPIAIANMELSYIIVIPTFYKSTVWANGAITCTFTELGVSSPCENYETEIIITETFPANYTSLTLTISKILNPSLETYCDTDDVTLLSQTFFKIRIIEVLSNKFLFESSSVVDSENCLKFESIRIPISLEHPLVMVAGLAYNLTYGIERPASNLKIRASTTANGFTFSPDMVKFDDYYSLKKSTTIYLRSDISPGTYTISFEKFESEQQTYFRNILPTNIQVLSPSSSTFTKPTISVPAMTASTIGYPVQVPIEFSLPSSTQMTLFIKISEESNQTLAEYSTHLSNFSLEPRIINIIPQVNNFSFTVTQGKRVVPPPLTLTFTLTSVYPIIHELKTTQMTLCFDQDPTYDVLNPPLRVRLTEFASSCKRNDIGKPVTNIFVSNSSSYSSSDSVKPEIVQISTSNIRSTTATMTVNTRTSGTVYYLCIEAGYPLLSNASEIIAMSNQNGIVGSVSSNAQNIYNSETAQINYRGVVDLQKLSSSTKYNFYAVLSSQLGVSKIKREAFETTDLSKGVLMKLTFNEIVSNLDVVKSLERIIRISPLRIKVLTSSYELLQIQSSMNSYKNNPKYVYEVVIAPDPTNDTTTPMDIVEDFTTNDISKGLFKDYLPDWDQDATIQYFELRAVKPRVSSMPEARVINLYNATFQMKMWERANIYYVLIKHDDQPEDTLTIANKKIKVVRVGELSESEQAECPSSLQIRQGKDVNNVELNQYQHGDLLTDKNGKVVIFLQDLKPGSTYDVFITSSSYLPYEPTRLWLNEEVIRLTYQTMYNPNLMGSNRHIDELKAENPGLGGAIERFIKNEEKKRERGESNARLTRK